MNKMLRDERGVALATALAILSVLSVTSASLFAVSTRLSGSSTASRDAKRALAAADAGFEAAVFRMNELDVQETDDCFTTAAVAPGTGSDPIRGTTPAAGECAGVREDMGNGSRYTYFVTPELQDGDVCAGLPVTYSDSVGKVTVTQRCVTSVGESNGEVRRVQARVAAYIGTQLFPVGGILAINGIKVKNTAIVSGLLGSNGAIVLGNNSYISQGIELGTASTPLPTLGSGSSLGGPISYRSASEGPFLLAPVDMGNTALPGENDNGRISAGQDSGSQVTYTDTAASPRTLTIGNNGSLTLSGDTYNFCKVVLGNGAIVKVAAGARVRFFLDSPDRLAQGTAGDCIPTGMTAATARSAGWGGMQLGQQANFTASSPPAGHAIDFQIYMYGYANGTHSVEFNNGVVMRAAIYAPNSNLIWNNSAGIAGAVSASTVDFKNSAAFTWDGESGDADFSLEDLRTDTVSVHYRMAWKECQRQRTTTTDPESGC